ncbi:unnamed protein product, partial [Rotaria sordida]
IFDIRTQPRSVSSITGIKGILKNFVAIDGDSTDRLDLQTINITLRILYQPRAELLPKIFTNLGLDYEERSQFDAIQLIIQRTLISQRVSELVTECAAQFGLLLDDISITHLNFRPEFTSAVELKQRF